MERLKIRHMLEFTMIISKRLSLLFAFTLLFAFSSSLVRAQVDTEFWFAAPSLVAEHTPNAVSLVIVAYDEDATVSITQPAAGRTLIASRQVSKNSTYTLPLRTLANYRQNIETQADGQVHQTGIHITATAKVTAYYVATNPNSEVYTLKGNHALGQEFVVPMQFTHACGHNAYGSIEVVATQDGTTVTFQTLVPTNLGDAGTYTVALSRGETYAIRTLTPNTPANMLLGGTIVTANHPIAVNTTDDSAVSGADLDLIGEQLVPTEWAGSHYIVVANNSNKHDYAYCFAISDSTDIYTSTATGPQLVGTIAPGSPLSVRLTQLTAQAFYSDTNTPFVLMHMTANDGGNELSGTVLPSLNCSGSEEVNYVPALSDIEARVSLLVHTEDIGSFLLNGQPSLALDSSVFQPVPGDSAWSYIASLNLVLNQGENSFHIQNTTGVFHMGVLDSGGGACSYGFFSNYGHVSLFASPSQSFYFVGDTLHLHVTGANTFSHITWTGPNGALAPDVADLYIPNATAADAGLYIVQAEHAEGCDVQPDTVVVNVFPAIHDQTKEVCRGDSVRMRAAGDGPYTWYKDGLLMAEQTSRTYKYLPDGDAFFTIEDQLTGVNMIPWADSLPLTLPEADSIVLWRMDASHLIVGAEYVWTIVLDAPMSNAVAPKVRAWRDDVPGTLVAIPNSSTPTRIVVRWTADRAYARLRLSCISPRPERSLRIKNMTLRPLLEVTENIDVIYSEPFDVSIVGDTLLCDGVGQLGVDVIGTRYHWSTGDTTATITISHPGKYAVYVWDGSCFAEAKILVDGAARADWHVGEVGDLCEAQVLEIPVTVNSGDVDGYNVYFSPEAKEAGFADRINMQPQTGLLRIAMPNDVLPGRYTLEVEALDGVCSTGERQKVSITIPYPNSVFAQRWNDILGVKNADYNGGYQFVAYQWYRNGVEMPGCTSSYIYVPEEFQPGDTYTALLTRADGVQMLTCPYVPVKVQYEGDGLERIYDVQGNSVPEAKSPGLYIRIRGNERVKILIP